MAATKTSATATSAVALAWPIFFACPNFFTLTYSSVLCGDGTATSIAGRLAGPRNQLSVARPYGLVDLVKGYAPTTSSCCQLDANVSPRETPWHASWLDADCGIEMVSVPTQLIVPPAGTVAPTMSGDGLTVNQLA